MADRPEDPKDDSTLEQLEELHKEAEAGELSPKERFKKTSHIALLMSYDLIDKLRYWEKETLAQPEDQIDQRLESLVSFIEQFRAVYMKFADQDF